jgi:hypothetical protein
MANAAAYAKHADLVARMAAVQGADLDEAQMRGEIDPETLHDVVLSCSACTDPEACREWMAARDDGAGGTPDYCRNADLMGRISGDA